MAKNKTNNNDLFSNFKAPKIDRQKEETPKSENKPEEIPVVKEVEPSKVVEEVKPDVTVQPAQFIDDMAFAMPRSGRPKTLEGKYHIFTARLREDLFEYAQSITGKDKESQSVNDLINRLIAKEMLSKMGGKK